MFTVTFHISIFLNKLWVRGGGSAVCSCCGGRSVILLVCFKQTYRQTFEHHILLKKKHIMHTNILQYHCLQSCKQCNIGKHLSTSVSTKHLKEKKCFYTIFQRQKWITFSELSFFSSDTISKILKYKNTEIMNYLLEKLLKLSNSVAAGCHEFTDT